MNKAISFQPDATGIDTIFSDLGVNPHNSQVLPVGGSEDWRANMPNCLGKTIVLPTQGHAAAQLLAYLFGSGSAFTHSEFRADIDPSFSFNPKEIYDYARGLVSERARGGKVGELRLNADRHDIPKFTNLQLGNNTVTNEGWYQVFVQKVVDALADYNLDEVQVAINSAAFGPANVAVVMAVVGAIGRWPIVVRSTPTEKAIDSVDLQSLKNEGMERAREWATESAPVTVPAELFQQVLDVVKGTELEKQLRQLK